MLPRRAHPVDAAFIFLDLLEGQIEGLGQTVLGNPQHFAAFPDALADTNVNGMWKITHIIAPRQCNITGARPVPAIWLATCDCYYKYDEQQRETDGQSLSRAAKWGGG